MRIVTSILIEILRDDNEQQTPFSSKRYSLVEFGDL